MKIAFLLLFASAQFCLGQSSDRYGKESPTTTNDFRVVNGQLYNIQKSKLWQWQEVLPIRKSTNGLLVWLTKPVYGPAIGGGGSGNFLTTSPPYHPLIGHDNIRQIIFLNAGKSPIGEHINLLAMKVGTRQLRGDDIEVWDCGLPNRPGLATNLPPATVSTKRQ